MSGGRKIIQFVFILAFLLVSNFDRFQPFFNEPGMNLLVEYTLAALALLDLGLISHHRIHQIDHSAKRRINVAYTCSKEKMFPQDGKNGAELRRADKQAICPGLSRVCIKAAKKKVPNLCTITISPHFLHTPLLQDSSARRLIGQDESRGVRAPIFLQNAAYRRNRN